jgi:hypothetical protein
MLLVRLAVALPDAIVGVTSGVAPIAFPHLILGGNVKATERSNLLLGFLLALLIIEAAPGYSLQYAEMAMPLDAPYLGLTGTFGEYRPGRFHMGIDFRTRANGLRVAAAKDGYVARIGVRKRDFGKVLYLKHPDGTATVYAHLDRFEDEKAGIESLVKDAQRKRGAKYVEIYPEPGRIKVKKGQLIGYSGETGAGLPHLHFELRSESGVALNPLRYGLTIYDGYLPTFESITLQPLDEASMVNGDYGDVEIAVAKVGTKDGRAVFSAPSSEATPVVSGRVRIGVSTYDYVGNGEVPVGVYKLTLYIDGALHHTVAFDRVSYDETHKAPLVFDHDLSRLRPTQYYYNLYRLTGNDLPYNVDYSQGDGIWDTHLSDDGKHTIEIIAEDARGNKSLLSLPVVVANGVRLAEVGGGMGMGEWGTSGDAGLRERLTKPLSPLGARLIDHPTFVEIVIDPQGTSPGSLSVEVDGRPLKLVYKGKSVSGIYPKSWDGPGRRTAYIKAADGSGYATIKELRFAVQRITREGGGTIESGEGMARLSVPPEGAYDHAFVNAERVEVQDQSNTLPRLSSVYRFTPSGLAFSRGASVSIAYPEGIDSRDVARVGVYQYDRVNKAWDFLGRYNGESPPGMASAEVNFLSTYALLLDNSPPRITFLFPGDGREVAPSGLKEIYALMEDVGMGLDEESMLMLLDGKKVEAEFDPDRNKLSYQLENALAPGPHDLRVVVKDLAGNEALPLVSRFRVVGP